MTTLQWKYILDKVGIDKFAGPFNSCHSVSAIIVPNEYGYLNLKTQF